MLNSETDASKIEQYCDTSTKQINVQEDKQMKHYKMSMIKKNGCKDYYGLFSSKEEAESIAKDFMELDSNYVDFVIIYTE